VATLALTKHAWLRMTVAFFLFDAGGAITPDALVPRGGLVSEPFLNQLQAIGRGGEWAPGSQ
jgi:hypothetical protein